VSGGPYASILAGDLVRRTPRFDLVPLQPSDAAALLETLADSEVVRFMDIEPLAHPDQARSLIARAESLRTAGAGVRWAIRARADGAFVGTCGFQGLVWERGCRGEIGYEVAQSFWGAHVMDEIMPLLTDFGFTALGLRRLEAFVAEHNHRSCRVLERHGFLREGLLRDYGFWKDAFWNQLIYARLG